MSPQKWPLAVTNNFDRDDLQFLEVSSDFRACLLRVIRKFEHSNTMYCRSHIGLFLNMQIWSPDRLNKSLRTCSGSETGELRNSLHDSFFHLDVKLGKKMTGVISKQVAYRWAQPVPFKISQNKLPVQRIRQSSEMICQRQLT